ncbi:AraC family transcriptional regulator [Shumkonia mesophila]|uniref:AraC family transcriptional regulator n=1 Tax=Shumkonia mesophila TaxID=2838854 RepID=UPI0029342477|nr:AraC family transcriptional regulator [Shumkonia mesophila]
MDKTRELAHQILRHAREPGLSGTAVQRLSLIRADVPTVPTPSVYEASLCLIAQGSKRVSLGERSVVYDASHYLLVSVDLPLVGHVLEATPAEPYLCCKIDLDPTVLADLLATQSRTAPSAELSPLAVYPADPDLFDAACRLVRLLDRPEHIATLAPLIEREILYRLLMGPHGPTLRRMAAGDSRLGRIGRAIAWIRTYYREPLRIDDIASAAHMSPSSLHEHFKAVTTLTPLEFQKQLRLQEARRLMLAKGATAGAASFSVGYQSPSQFSREYRRLFGAPPRRDVDRLQRVDLAAN